MSVFSYLFRCKIQEKAKLLFSLLILFVLSPACRRAPAPPDDPEVWKKIGLDFRKFDENGLKGSPDGKYSTHYEFCIPAEEKAWKKVKKIDPNAGLMKGSSGRSGCRPDRWLVVSSTNQPHFKRVLYDLARLPFVEKISETFFE